MAIGQELTHLGPNDFSNDSFQIVPREVCYMIIIIMMLVVLVVVVEMTVMMIHGHPASKVS